MANRWAQLKAEWQRTIPHAMTISFVQDPTTWKVVAVTRDCSHNPVYEMHVPTPHEASTAQPVPRLNLRAW